MAVPFSTMNADEYRRSLVQLQAHWSEAEAANADLAARIDNLAATTDDPLTGLLQLHSAHGQQITMLHQHLLTLAEQILAVQEQVEALGR